MKKVLYLSYDGMTDPLGQSQVIPYLQQLTQSGYQFTIISFEKKDRIEKNGNYIQQMLDKSGIKWQPEQFSRKPPVLSKLYDLWKIKRRALQLHKKEKFDFIHCRSYVAAGAGLYIFRKTGTPFLFDMRGFWVDERLDNGQWKLKNPMHRFFYNYYKKREKIYFEKAFQIISLTWKGKNELVSHYSVPAGKITVIPCCVDLVLFDYHTISTEEIAAKKEELNISKSNKVISYLGSFGGWYLLKEMFDFYIAMKKEIPELKFLFITPSPAESVRKAANDYGINTSDLVIKSASRKEVPLYLALSDWSVFFIKDGYSKIASSPTKQGEIMAMGIPIVCNDVGDTGKIIEASKSGIVINGFTTAEFNRISRQQSLLNLSREHIRQSAFEYFDLNKGAKEYLEVYKLAGE